MKYQNTQVVLLEKKGYRYSIWLPKEREGKYCFPPNELGIAPSISIVGAKGKWYVVDSFADSDKNPESIAYGVIEEGAVIEIADSRRGEKYIVYEESNRESNQCLLPYTFERESEIVLGRDDSCDLIYGNAGVSRKHVSFFQKKGIWYVRDLGSLNGTYLNNHLVVESELVPGDKVFVMDVCIVYGINYFCINNADSKIRIASHRVRPVNFQTDIEVAKPDDNDTIDCFFERSPRKMYRIPVKPIEFEMPPMSIKGGKLPLLLRMGSSVINGGNALLTGNILSATTSLFLPGLSQGLTEKEQKEYEEKRNEVYQYYLNEKKKELLDEKHYEERRLNEVYPELSQVVDFATNSERLWERRQFDEDYLKVRLGVCQLPLLAEVKIPPKRIEVERDDLVEAMYSLAENRVCLENAPVLLSLRDDFILGLKGELRKKKEFIRNLVLQLAFTHSYDEVKIALIGNETALSDLHFAKYLPHIWSDDRSIRFWAENRSDVQQLSAYFSGLLDGCEERGKKISQNYVVIILNKSLYDYIEPVKVLCETKEYKGFTIINAFSNLPKECRKLIQLENVNTIRDLLNPGEDIAGFELDRYEPEVVRENLGRLGNTRLKLDDNDYTLPTSVEFLEMYGVTRVEHLNPLKRWKENDPTKSLAAPIGIGGDGKQFILDLHEKKQGPHGLIAGGTGSGKSEFIISYILSMAINYSPDEVAFILIDYKGGGLADAFVDEKRGIHLPHVVGTITNLDGSAINRSLMSIHSELKRRQTVFKNAKSATNEGTMDIYDYQRLYRSGKVAEPLPHLFIISDEFAELKKQQPDFMDELISTARIGRSLGVHLILATQKPSGVVNDQIWSNSKFRICLKVADRGDSQEMLKRPEAAEIKNTGRFFLQVGYNDFFAQGQAGWCGAGYFPGEGKKADSSDEIEFLDNVGHHVFTAKPQKEVKKAECKQVVAIVQYLSELASKDGIVPKQLWCAPLDAKIDYDAIEKSCEKEKVIANLGMSDDPENQVQFLWKLDMLSIHHMLLVGPSGCGKSELIRTLLLSLTEKYSTNDVNYYIADYSRGALSEFASLPHCGAYITESDEQSFERLLALVNSFVETRKQQFLDAHVTTFEGYRKLRKMPIILIVIDGYNILKGFKKGNDYHSNLFEYLKKGSAYGIKFLISVDRVNEIYSRTRAEVDYKIAFQGKDKYEYSDILDCKNAILIPSICGRAEAVVNGTPLECHVAMMAATQNEFERTACLKKRLEELKEKWKDNDRAICLETMRPGETYEDFLKLFETGRIPLGYYLRDLKRVSVPLKQLHCVSVYIGNPIGSDYYIRSFLMAARKNDMRILFVKRTVKSFADEERNKQLLLDVECLQTTPDDISRLSEIMLEELTKRTAYRDEYCKLNNIPLDYSEKALAARDYVMAHTKPLLVFFESFGEMCRFADSDLKIVIEQRFNLIFGKTKGYNVYFFGLFYPEDEKCGSADILRSFNEEQFGLFFGGRYDKQCISGSIPSEMSRMTKANPAYDEFIMKYRNEFYGMKMPLGELIERKEDEDIASIV